MRTSFLLLTCMLLAGMAMARPGQSKMIVVPLFVDGKAIDFTSAIVSDLADSTTAHMPVYLVNNNVLLPVRLFDEILGDHLDLHLVDWGIVQLSYPGSKEFAFRIGSSEAVTAAPMIGGDLPAPFAMRTAPRIIHGRLYVPAMALYLLDHTVEWDNTAKALRVTRRSHDRVRY